MKQNKIFQIAKKVIINLIIIILAIIAIFTIWIFIQLNVQNKEYIDIFGYSMFSTETESMFPEIKKEDIVIVKIGAEFNEEDIITYKKENSFITHRVVKINEKSIIAQGDNNNTQDEEITQDAVLGKVVYIIKNVEIWKNVFSDRNVIIPIIITVILLVLLVSYKEKTEQQTGEKE